MYSRPREILEEFINVYRESPCLWKIKEKDYRNRQKKEEAYGRLIEIIRELEPSANKDFVIKKINNLRSNIRKEVKKVKEPKSAGNQTEYVPKLWYYHLFSFLHDDQDTSQTSHASDNESEELNSNYEIIAGSEEGDKTSGLLTNDDISTHDFSTPSKASTSQPCPTSCTNRWLSYQEALTAEALRSANDHFMRPQVVDDRHDIFGKNVAMALRDVPQTQRILAEKLINEVLFEAQMGTLSMDHRLIGQVEVTITQDPHGVPT